jgi:protein phosphatase
MNLHKAQLEVGARSETGYVRDENQDRMSGTRVPLGQLYIVADGMGGHKGGAVAAELTVQGLQQYIGEAPANASVEEIIQMAFTKTNETVYQKAHSGDPATEGMGSTAVLLLISGRVARVAHMGDSRAYLYRKGRLKQLTTDHTIVQKMVQAGMLKPEEAIDHPNASVLDRAIGSKPGVEVDIGDPLQLKGGDAILLCSDGLSGYVADPEIASVLQGQAPVQEIPERLVKLALEKGGADNVTVQFIQYGTRKEARLSTPKLLRPVFQMAAACVLGTAISAAGFYAYSQGRLSSMGVELNKKIEEQDKKIKDLEAQRVTADQSSNTKIGTLQKQLDEAKRKEDDLQKQLGEATAKVGKSQKESGEARRKEEDAQKRLEEATARASKLQKQLDEAKRKEEDAQKQSGEATARASKLQKQLDEAKRKEEDAQKQSGEINTEGKSKAAQDQKTSAPSEPETVP